MMANHSTMPDPPGEPRGRRDLEALRGEWRAVHGEVATVIESMLAQVFAVASRQAVEVLMRLEREGGEAIAELEGRRSAARAEMTELSARLEHLDRRVDLAEEERRRAIEATERATTDFMQRARHEAGAIVTEAEERAAARLAAADEEAARRIAAAEARAEEIVRQTRRQSDEDARDTEVRPVAASMVAPASDATLVEDQLRGLADRISRLLQTTGEVTGPNAPVETSSAAGSAGAVGSRAEAPRGEAARAEAPLIESPADWRPSTVSWQQAASLAAASPGLEPEQAPASSASASAPPAERDVVVPWRPGVAGSPWKLDADLDASTDDGSTADVERSALAAVEPDAWIAPAAAVDVEREPASVTADPAPTFGVHDEAADTYRPAGFGERRAARDEAPLGAGELMPEDRATPYDNAPQDAVAAAEREDTDAGDLAETSDGSPVQTLVFQAVPNFQAALALERALKGLAGVHEVRVADFDERQLTFQVTHDLGAGLGRSVLALRSHELDLVEATRDRAEFMFRA